jgi:hypothetical protein
MEFRIGDNWISEAVVIAATGASARNLAQWRAQGIVTGRRRFLGHAGTTSCFYPPDTISLIQRLYELQRQVRDADSWVWQLWLEGFSANVWKWAMMCLKRALDLVEQASPDSMDGAALRAAQPTIGTYGRGQGFFDRVRKSADREAFASWVSAAFAGYEQQASIHNAEPPIFDIALKAMGIPRSTLAPPKANFDGLSVCWFYEILATAKHDEREQARRDWQAITRLVEALDAADWNIAGSEIEAKIEALTKSRPEPPSKRQRRAGRQRPYTRPGIVDLFVEGLSGLEARPYLLALFVGIRRSSPENSDACSQAIALAESFVSHLPRLATDMATAELIG